MHYVYLLECLTTDHFYVGTTTNLKHRYTQHLLGNGCRFTAVHGVRQLMKAVLLKDIHRAHHTEREWIDRLLHENPDACVRGAGRTQSCPHIPLPVFNRPPAPRPSPRGLDPPPHEP